jgi:hypothetical protein
VEEALKSPFNALMRAVFKADYNVAEKEAVTRLANPETRSETGMFRVNAVAAKALPNGDVVLIANAAVTDEDGSSMPSHADSGYLNVFLLRQQDGHWQVLRRHENVAALGSTGHFGQVEWVELAPGKPGFAILHGWSGQGYNLDLLSLFDLSAEEITDLTGESIKIHSDNAGTCDDENPECWDVTGAWHITSGAGKSGYGDLTIKFSGEHSTAPTNPEGSVVAGVKRVTAPVASTARYVFDGNQYRLVEGVNVVPDI